MPNENWFSYNCISIDLIWLLFRCHSLLIYIEKEKYILLWWKSWIACIFYCRSSKNQSNLECFIWKVFQFEFIGLTKSDCGKHLLALKINFLWRKTMSDNRSSTFHDSRPTTRHNCFSYVLSLRMLKRLCIVASYGALQSPPVMVCWAS